MGTLPPWKSTLDHPKSSAMMKTIFGRAGLLGACFSVENWEKKKRAAITITIAPIRLRGCSAGAEAVHWADSQRLVRSIYFGSRVCWV